MSLFKRNTSRKSIRLYMAFAVSDRTQPLCFTSSKEETQQVIEKQIYINHYEHFKMWCNLRGVTPSIDSDAWYDYYIGLSESSGSDDPRDRFYIIDAYYSLDDIASFMRMFAHCPPFDLPHERPEELETYIVESGLSSAENILKDPVAEARIITLKDMNPYFKEKYAIAYANTQGIIAAKTPEEKMEFLAKLQENQAKQDEEFKKHSNKSN